MTWGQWLIICGLIIYGIGMVMRAREHARRQKLIADLKDAQRRQNERR